MPRRRARADRDRASGDGAGAGRAEPARGLRPSSEERKARLARTVHEKTREFRATRESEGDFHAVLVRGKPVNHLLHFIVLVCLVAGVSAVARLFSSETTALLAAAGVGAVYGLFWLGLALTGGLEREHISVDEAGQLSSVRSGRKVETRENYLKVGIPGAIILVGVVLGVGLIHDIAIPPPPHCNAVSQAGADECLIVPNLGQLPGVGPTPSPAPAASPVDAVEESPSTLSREATILVERFVRGFLLVILSVFVLAAIWFLRRMLNGEGVLWIEPVRGRKE
jgi:hypothetical protein